MYSVKYGERQNMSLTNDSSNMVMPVSPMNGGGGFANGMWGDGGLFWLIILFLFMFNGNWGGGFGANGGAIGADVQRGFDQQAIITGINGIQTSLCNGFAGVNQGVSNGFAQAEIAANARQMADMNQNFALQSALQNCCCENRAATADLKYTVATEACNDRNAVAQALQSVTAQNNANTQRILDQLCQDKIDAKNEEIANLRTQINLANLAASQNAQTAAIQAGQRNLANEIEQYVLPTPRPAYVVQNPNCCQNYGWNGCGCVA